MKNYKNGLKGLAIAGITLAYWFLIMFVGDRLRLANPKYRDIITLSFIISAIIVNLILVYLFYRKAEIKNKGVLMAMILPYLLLLVATDVVALNIPRSLDIAFLLIGAYLIFKITENKTQTYKPLFVVGIYFIAISAAYPYLYKLIENNISIN